jgi:Ner family transcriptional regulator
VHPEDIKASLRKKGSSLTAIARDLGLAVSTVSHVLVDARSRRVERRIAKVLGTTPSAIWPDRYKTTMER